MRPTALSILSMVEVILVKPRSTSLMPLVFRSIASATFAIPASRMDAIALNNSVWFASDGLTSSVCTPTSVMFLVSGGDKGKAVSSSRKRVSAKWNPGETCLSVGPATGVCNTFTGVCNTSAVDVA
ncbi:hypothetical protein DPMN_071805 [Dreissena polymorpha]|uniref:Uncharacterized protein n=1 Tax=Dreissena polymorpha TaxID=45954 RepID=A0A9D4BPZ6_DREPO|nr:hypothetical protein DPMN_071805 [Dreissena polymorpha]